MFYLANMYYILTNQDETKNIHEVRTASCIRADIQKQIEIRQGELSQAVQLLEIDLTRRPELRWLLAIVTTLLIIGTGSGLYIYNRRKKHQLLSQKLYDLQSAASSILKKHHELTELYNANHTRIKEEINQTCVLLLRNKNLQKEIAWQDFEEMCKIIDSHFYLLASKLRSLQVLNETEIRLCVLVLIGLNRAQIADILPYARNSVGKLKDHTAQSLGTTGKNLHEFLLDLAIKG
jgi:DNA-binding CsgD family transcriptional regulator